MVRFSTAWKASTNPGKQRKYRAQAPLHTKRKLMGCHLAPALRKKYQVRTLPVRTQDMVKIMRGQHRKTSGKVERVDAKRGLVYVAGIMVTKKDGSKVPVGIRPSNIMISEMHLEDKRRVKTLERKKK